MSPQGVFILRQLAEVEHERSLRRRDAELAARVTALKEFQHARLERTYADLLASTRYAEAARFFLDDLYGPHDFTERDAQFSRIVPALVRLFPAEIVTTVAHLSELHALSERLDSRMAECLRAERIDDAAYVHAWQIVGEPQLRQRQIQLMRMVGEALDRYTRRKALRHSLRLMRVPARAAGLLALHRFLERGFDTFGAMQGASEFLDTIVERERRLVERLFDVKSGSAAVAHGGLAGLAVGGLVQLP